MWLLVLFGIISAQADSIRVGVIDTGLDLSDPRFVTHLCPSGHKDFTGEGIKDINGHGTHIAGLIVKYAKNSNYCLTIYKYYKDLDEYQVKNGNDIRYINALLESIYNEDVLVNFSGVAESFNPAEYLLMKKNKQTTFVVAAGNNSKNLDLPANNYYPAKYNLNNIITVGSAKDGQRSYFSNYGSFIKAWENGEKVSSCDIKSGFITMQGTSQATAIHTGKLIYEIYQKSRSKSSHVPRSHRCSHNRHSTSKFCRLPKSR